MKKNSIAWERPILIGSCPSSGSTLLSVMLDAHPDVLCGPELSLFSHPFFWSLEGAEWRARLLRYISLGPLAISLPEWKLSNGLCPYALLLYSNTLPWYGITCEELKNLVQKCSNANELVRYLYGPVMQAQGKIIWAEKSPPNIYSFGAFLERYPEGKVLYLVRDGRDVICSLNRRKFGFKRALSVWLIETAISELYKDHPRVHRIRYEDLVINPRTTVENILSFLDLPFDVDSVLNYQKKSLRALSDDASIDAGIPVWLNNPRQPLSSRSVGNWQNILSPEQAIAFESASIVQSIKGYEQLEGETTLGIIKRLDYETNEEVNRVDIAKLCRLVTEEELFLSGNDYGQTNIFQERFVECDIMKLPKAPFSWEERRFIAKLNTARHSITNTNDKLKGLEHESEKTREEMLNCQKEIVSMRQDLVGIRETITDINANLAGLRIQMMERTSPLRIISRMKINVVGKLRKIFT
jgi:hypothetical protein